VPSDPTLLSNRFQLDSLIAEGGMAKVYKGTDLLLGRTVAIKVLAANLARDPNFVVRFEREARAAASLSHVNVVNVYDTGSDGDLRYIVMEYIDGRALSDIISTEGSLDPARAAGIAATVCEALAVAHAAGMVHRDVKPGNIMIDTRGVVKVMDFGIAKTSSDGLTQVGSILGTVAYLSPEQALGEPVDRRSDIYSLGCVLYEMLTGRPPIAGETLVEVAHKLTTYNPPPPSEINPQVPASLDAIVARAIAKDPDDRFDNALQMREALESGELALTPPDQTKVLPAAAGAATVVAGSRTEVLHREPRRPRRVGLLVAGALLIGAGLYAMLTDFGASQPPADSGTLQLPEPATVPPVTTTTPATTTRRVTSTAAQPATSVLPDRRGPAILGAVARIRALLSQGTQSGSVTQRAARDVTHDLDRAIRQVEQGDYGDAVNDLQDARNAVDKSAGKSEIDPATAAALNAALSQFAQVLVG
jgi:tRNA A-37 threonylcarbamoyl transferase component Bud32